MKESSGDTDKANRFEADALESFKAMEYARAHGAPPPAKAGVADLKGLSPEEYKEKLRRENDANLSDSVYRAGEAVHAREAIKPTHIHVKLEVDGRVLAEANAVHAAEEKKREGRFPGGP